MKKLLQLCCSLVVVFSVLMSALVLNVSAQYGMETDNFDVDVVVHENNSFSVKNKINVKFNIPKHGIYYYVKYKGQVTREIDGKKAIQKYRASIKNIKVEGGPCDTSYQDGYVLFKIGDADRELIGKKSYTISYDYILSDDKIDSMDDVYFNLIPTKWDTSIKSSNITVLMPKAFDKDKVDFYVGNDYSTDIDKNYTIDGNRFTSILKKLDQGVGATLKINLPEGYFVGEKTDTFMYVLLIVLPVASFVILLVLWLLFGRNKKVIQTVEFYPPEGMTSAEVGYIIDGTIDNKDIISLIIYWADKGYLSITTFKDNKDDFLLTKRKNLPISAKNYEKVMFDGLFRERDSVHSTDLKDTFYKTMSATQSSLNYYLSGAKQQAFTNASRICRAIGCVLAALPITLYILISGYINIDDTMFLAGFSIVLLTALNAGLSYNYQVRNSINKRNYILLNFVYTIAIGIICLINIGLGISSFNSVLLAIMTSAMFVVGSILCMLMPTRTDNSNELLGKILGLRDFIKVAELDRIKALCDENPQYFYNVLPYAYVLGLSDKWAKRFESINIQPPNWYSGYNSNMFTTYMFIGMLNRQMNTANQVMISKPAPQGSSGGFSGGFGGGGGFSGGGFGGGGGGSW